VAAIPKASRAEHARSNFEVFDFELSSAEMDAIGTVAAEQG
jgi:diketogulonate reductase-like aldo/keto reductase